MVLFEGILTFLTTVTIGLSGRSDLPKLDYLTALDIYILMTMGYVLAAFVEYAGVNYFTKITKPDDCKPIYAFRPDELVVSSAMGYSLLELLGWFFYFHLKIGYVEYILTL